MSCYLTVLILCKEGNAPIVKQRLLSLLQQSRSEPACLQYDLHQSLENKNLFIFQEEWASEAGWEAHNQQPYVTHFGSEAADLLDGPIRVYRTEKLA
jgi:quinol monooxygenase YgiN